MTNIRDIFARNLRENRRKSGLTQAKLAEKADISTHYVAMIELAQNFPKADIIERISTALNIEIYELFLLPHSRNQESKESHRTIVKELKSVVEEAVENAFKKRDRKIKKT